MAARSTKAKTTADATEDAGIPVDEGNGPDAKQKRTRTPKPVTDLATATTALKAAQRRADRAGNAYADAVKERDDANAALTEAKATVQRYYNELMGIGQTEDVTEAYAASVEPEGDPENEG